MSDSHIQSHVELIAKHEQEFLAKRTPAERIGDAVTLFAGSLRFVTGQLLLFAAWIVWNTVGPKTHRFDPAPFSLLGAIVSMEAILLASLILARQSRMGRREDEREHLMLQILLLTEKEVTTALNLERQIARRLGLDKAANTAEVQELSQPISVEKIAESIQENLSNLEDGEPQETPDGTLNL
jgi:uncharacterized membrane protein